MKGKLEGAGSFYFWEFVNNVFFWTSAVLIPDIPAIFQRVGRVGSEGACPAVGLDEQAAPAGAKLHSVAWGNSWLSDSHSGLY